MSPLRLNLGGSGERTITHLLDGTMNVWRPTESVGAARETIRNYGDEPVYANVACTSTRKRTGLVQDHGGQTPAGARTVFADIGPAIMEGDLIQLVTGPGSPAVLRAESVAEPRGHHLEITATEYQGKLPEQLTS